MCENRKQVKEMFCFHLVNFENFLLFFEALKEIEWENLSVLYECNNQQLHMLQSTSLFMFCIGSEELFFPPVLH